MSDQSLYDRIGGESAVKATVVKLYEKILSDDLLAPFFDDIDMEKLRRSQSAFVTMAFGGPHSYSGPGLRKAHAPMVKQGLSDAHFDGVVKYLGESMAELNVPADLIQEAADLVETTRKDVLNRA